MVLIQEKQTIKSNLPVQLRTVKAIPLASPVIAAVTPGSVQAGDVLPSPPRS